MQNTVLVVVAVVVAKQTTTTEEQLNAGEELFVYDDKLANWEISSWLATD